MRERERGRMSKRGGEVERGIKRKRERDRDRERVKEEEINKNK